MSARVYTKYLMPVFFLFALIPLVSCQVGLGEAVDTEAPKVAITYPAAAVVIRGHFIIAGTCSDDEGVISVKVVLTDTDTEKKYDAEAAALGSSKKTWQISLNEYDSNAGAGTYNGWALPDGKYTADVTASDAAGRTSGTSSISFEIDNTKPVFILSSPGTTDINNPTAYGTSFKVNGTIADDHTIKAMDVTVYSKSGKELKSFETTNVETAGGTSVTLAKKGGTTEQDAGYGALYGTGSGTVPYYCTISLTDSAKVYQNPDETENTTVGNMTTVCYLYDNIYDKLMGKKSAYGLEASDIKKILNGTYTGSADTAAVLKILDANETDTGSASSYAAFSLNPDADPTYSVQGYSCTADTIGDNTGTANQKITVTLKEGRDGVLVDPSTMAVYLFGPYDTVPDTSTLDTIYGEPATGTQIAENSSYSGGTAESYTYTLSLPARIIANKVYLIAVEGKDADGVAAEKESSGYYGFKGSVSGKPPTITITTPDDLSYAGSGVQSFSGTASTDTDGITSVSYTVAVTDESGSTSGTLYTITGSASPQKTSDGVYGWSFDLQNGTGYQTVSSGKQYLYTATVTAYDANGNSSEATRRVHIDTKAPDVSITSVTPTVVRSSDSKTCVNGTITLTGAVSETNFGTATLTAADKESGYSVKYQESSYSFTESINTTTEHTFTDGDTLTLTLTATDKAGNVSVPVTVSYIIDQSTDEPVVSLSNASMAIKSADSIKNAYTNSASVTNIFGTASNNKLLGTVTDDDGIASISIAYDTASDGQYANTIYKNDAVGGTTSFTIPNASFNELPEGLYYLKITVADKTQATSYATYAGSYFAVAVDNGGPAFSSVTPANGGYYSSSKPLTVSGTVTDSSGVVTITTNSGNGTGSPQVSLKIGSTTAFTLADTVTPPAADGSYAIVYTAADRYGQTSSYEIDYMVDTTAPSVFMPSTTSNFTKTTTKSVEVYVSDQCGTDGTPYTSTVTSGIATVAYSINGGSGNSGTLNYYSKYTGSSIANINTYYSIYKGTIILTDGVANTITYTITDNAGNSVTYTDPSTYTVDATAPVIKIDNGTSSINTTSTNSGDLSFTIDATDNKSIADLTVSGITNSAGTTVEAGTDYTVTTTASTATEITKVIKILASSTTATKHDGKWSFTINATDSAGWTAETRTITAQVDSQKPKITVDDTAERNVVYNVPQSYSGTMSDNIGVTGVYYVVMASNVAPVYDSSNSSWKSAAVNTGSGTWAVTADLSSTAYNTDDTWYIFFAAKDALGNAAVSSVGAKVTLDRAAPEVEITSPGLTTTSKTDVTVSGTVKEKNLASLVVTATKNGTNKGTFYTFDETTSPKLSELSTGVAVEWSFTLPALSDHTNDGTWVFTVTAKDKAGQSVSKTVSSILIDTTAPVISVTNSELGNNATIIGTSAYYKKSGSDYIYTIVGTWKDIDSSGNAGSGAKTLEYSTDYNEATASWSNWQIVSGTTTTSGTSSAVSFEAAIPVGQGTDKNLALRATDAKDIVSVVTSYTGITFDYSAPTLTMGTPVSYVLSTTSETTVVTGTYSDTDAMDSTNPITVTATYGSNIIQSGENGYRYSTSDGTVKIYLTGNSATNNGLWTFDVKAKDIAGQEKTVSGLKTTVDTIAPDVSNLAVSTTDSMTDSGITYFKSTLPLTFTVNSTDTGGSGVSRVTYAAVKGNYSAWSSSATYTYISGTASAWDETANLSGGVWKASITDFIALGSTGDGDYTIFAKATDVAGNEGISAGLHIVADCTVPTLAEDDGIGTYTSGTTTLSDGTSKGFSLSGTLKDSYFKSITATRSINNATAEDITLTTNTTVGTIDGKTVTSGTWSYEQTVPDTGTYAYTYTITATDKAGNKSYVSKSVSIDRTAPNVVVTSFAEQSNQSSYSFEGSASDEGGSQLKGIYVWLDTSSAAATTTSGSVITIGGTSSSWIWNTYNVESGNYYLHAVAVDNADNTSTDVPKKLIVDTTVPTTSWCTSSGALYTTAGVVETTTYSDNGAYTMTAGTTHLAGSTFVLKGNVDDNSTTAFATTSTSGEGFVSMAVTKDGSSYSGGEFAMNSDGVWTYTYATTPGDGTYVYTLTMTDAAGNTIAKSLTVLFDATAPVLSITKPTSNANETATTIALAGVTSDMGCGVKSISYTITNGTETLVSSSSDASDGNKVTITGGSWTATATPTGSSEGTLTFSVTATDYLGHTNPQTVTFYRDKTAPAISNAEVISGNANNLYATSTIGIQTEAADATSGVTSVTYSLDGTTWIPMTLSTGDQKAGIWKAASIVCAEGSNTIRIRATDAVSNTTAAADYVTISPKIDTKAPVLTTQKPATLHLTKTEADAGVSVSATATDVTSGTVKMWISTVSTADAAASYIVESTTTATTSAYTLSLTIPAIAFMTAGSYVDGNYTFYVHAIDAVGNEVISGGITFSLDTAAPVLTISNLASGSSSSSQKVYTESDVTDIASGTPRTATYTVSGTWFDKTSGTSVLQYTTNSDPANVTAESTATEASAMTTDAATEWVTVQNTTAVTNVTVSWTAALTVKESSGNSISFRAKDVYGNVTTPASYSNITFDFSAPKISVLSPTEDSAGKLNEDNNVYYVKGSASSSSQTLSEKATITDMRSMGANSSFASLITPTVTWKDSTVNFGDVTYNADGTTATCSSTSTEGTTPYATITETLSGTTVTVIFSVNVGIAHAQDGVWAFSLAGKDAAGRSGTAVSASATVDTVAPEPVAYDDSTNPFQVNDKAWSSSTWYKTTSMKIKGYFTENMSGLDEVYYYVKTPTGTAPTNSDITNQSSVSLSGSTGTDLSYTFTLAGFEADDGSTPNTLYIQAVDKAGNISALSNYTVHVDQDAPSIEADSTYTDSILTNGGSDISVTGTTYDSASGIASVTVYVGSGTTYSIKSDDSTYYGTIDLDKSGTYSVNNSKWTLSIYAKTTSGWFTEANLGTNPGVYAVVTDKAGNISSKTKICSLQIDTTPPKAVISTPLTGSSVNGKQTITGTVTEVNTPVSIALYSYEGDTIPTSLSGWALSKTITTEGNASESTTSTTYGASVSSIYNWSIADFDFASFAGTDGKATAYILPVAYDKAGNCSVHDGSIAAYSISSDVYTGYYTYAVDQDTDRPTIKISSLSKNSGILMYGTDSAISGTITDDDSTSSAIVDTLIGASGQITALTKTSSTEYTCTVDSTAGIIFSVSTGSGVTTYTNSTYGTTAYTSSSGDWTYTPPVKTDGSKDVYFYVLDNKGGKFYTAKDTSSPYLDDPYVQFKSNTKEDNSTKITYTADSKAPSIDAIGCSYGAGESVSNSLSAITNACLGGTDRRYFAFKVTADDANGIAGMTLSATNSDTGSTSIYNMATAGTIGSVTGLTKDTGGTFTPGSAGSNNTWTTKVIDLSAITTGTVTVKVTVYDQSGLYANSQTTFYIDNNKPSVSISSPGTTESDWVTSTVIVKGTASDTGNAGVNSVKWMIPTKTQVSSGIKADTEGWTAFDTSSSFSIAFTSADSSSTDSILHYANSTYTAETGTGTDVWDVPIYFCVTDAVGNTTIDNSNYVVVDVDSGRPSAKILYPETDATVGGTFTIYGTATDDLSVAAVNVQIDTNGDGIFNKTDYDALVATDSSSGKNVWGLTSSNIVGSSSLATGTAVSGTTYYTDSACTTEASVTVGSTDVSAYYVWNYYVIASGTNSWKLELDSTSAVSGVKLGIRVAAVDSYGNTRPYATTTGNTYVKVTIDQNVPQISDLKVVQYSSTAGGTSSKERAYTSGMYISNNIGNGAWYLTGTCTDETAVASIKFTAQTLTSTVIFTISGKTGDSTNPLNYTATSDKKIWTFYIALPTGTATSGLMYTQLSVTDNEGHSTAQYISINLDNTPPSLYDTNGTDNTDTDDTAVTTTTSLRLKHNSKNVSTSNVVENDNYLYTFGDEVTDANSGLAYLAFYFERAESDSTGNTRVYCPMYSSSTYDSSSCTYNTNPAKIDTTITSSTTSGKVYINTDGLACQYLTDDGSSARSSTTTFTNATYITSSNANIRAGGLIKIGGMYTRIESVDTTNHIITFADEVSTSFTSAEIIYAQVVDHTGKESVASDSKSVDSTTDDGDGMIETLTVSGSKYTWTASIQSDLITDGPVQIHVVAIDSAGNVSSGYVTTSVQNNRPRMTKVLLGTDLSRNGTYDFYGTTDIVNGTTDSNTVDGKTFGEFDYYSTLDRNTGKGKSSATLPSSSFIVKNGMCLIPEFTGGNTSIAYTLAVGDSAGTTCNTTADGSSAITIGSSKLVSMVTAEVLKSTYVADKTDTKLNVADQISSFGGVVLGNSTILPYESKTSSSTAVKYFTFTFWDKTEETTQGIDSQYALLNVPVIVDETDDTKPVPVIKPFYWNSITDNSIYDSSSASTYTDMKGHIELGTTPAVSGEISIKGTAYDETMLSALTLKITDIKLGTSSYGVSATLAEYDTTKGTWKYSVDGGSTFGTAGDACTATVASEGWHFAVTDPDGPTQAGHLVSWQLDLDTDKLNGVAGTGKEISIVASDGTNDSASSTTQTGTTTTTVYATSPEYDERHFYKSASAANTAGTTNVATGVPDASELTKGAADETYTSVYAYTYDVTPCYKVDVVPYITKVTTDLSDYYRSEPSVYARTAKGNYPVREDENITINGFNFTSSSTVNLGKLSYDSDKKTYSIAVGTASSGDLTVTTNGVGSINNSDDNTKDYNQQPNKVNNNLLTDDTVLDVWQFKTVATPKNGSIDNTHMKISPTGRIGFSFSNAVVFFSMPGRSSQTGTNTIYSQTVFAQDYGWYTRNNFCWGPDGEAYGCALCPDTNNVAQTANLSFMSRKDSGFHVKLRDSYFNGDNSRRIETTSISLNRGSSSAVGDDSDYITDIERTLTPAMVTSMPDASSAVSDSDNRVYVHMVYYDKITRQLRYRWGSVGTNSNDIQGNLLDLNGRTGSVDNDYITKGLDSIFSTWQSVQVQIVAASGVNTSGIQDIYKTATTYGAGKYADIGVLDNSTSDPVVVIAWYDSINGKLMLSWDKPLSTTGTGAQYGNWQSHAIVIDPDGGQYVSLAVDSAGGVHLAYYNNNSGDLKYAYVPTTSKTDPTFSAANVQCAIVDSFLAVGAKCTIDVADDSYGNHVPYIGYQMNGNLSTHASARVAKRVNFATGKISGTDANDRYTGYWEISTVPTQKTPIDDSINVGVYKAWTGTDKGKQLPIPKGTDVDDKANGGTVQGYAVSDSTIIHGNGTLNPAVSYACEEDGILQFAQKK